MVEMLEQYSNVVAVGICLCIGYVIKKWVKDVDNKYIPTVCAIVGVLVCIWVANFNITPEVILSGLFSGLAATGAHQAFTRLIEKPVESITGNTEDENKENGVG